MSYQAERKAWVAEITRRFKEDFEESHLGRRSWREEDTSALADMIAEYAVPDDYDEGVALCARLGLSPSADFSFALVYDIAYDGVTALLMDERGERGK